MKAILNTTGEVVDIEDMSIVTYKSSEGTYVKTLIRNFTFIDADKNYYTKLEHQYAGMAMQGLLANHYITDRIDVSVLITEAASTFANSLVEKYKEKEE